MKPNWRRLAILLVLHAVANPLLAEEPVEENDPASAYQPGVVAFFSGADGRQHQQQAASIAFAWQGETPNRRVPPGPFTARIEGHLLTRATGSYRLSVFAAGRVRLSLAGKQVLESSSPTPAWHAAEPIELEFGYQPLEILYERIREPARLSLYWEGPQFGFEPVGPQWLFHKKPASDMPSFAEGQLLARALRCAACHPHPADVHALPAPALRVLTGNLDRDWLVGWLSAESKDGAEDNSRRMPHFAFTTVEAAAVADALLSMSFEASSILVPSSARPVTAREKAKKPPAAEPEPSAAIGESLAHSVGCLACHRLGKLGTESLFGGGDLSRVADKRPPAFFTRWLLHPSATNKDHRMPIFALADAEAESLAMYLQSLAKGTKAEAAPAGDVELGRRLIAQVGCANCHALGPFNGSAPQRQPSKFDLAALEKNQGTCLAEPDGARHRPGYRLNAPQRAALSAFFRETSGVPQVGQTSEELLAEQNCQSCHARGQEQGLGARLPALAEVKPEFRDLLPALVPPPLYGIGDKLHDEALIAAIERTEAPRRPWLRVRMPKFRLADKDAWRIAERLIVSDRVPPRPETSTPKSRSASEVATLAAGARLVTAEGFGCTSCHAIGKWQPEKVAPSAHGSSLSELGKRVRREWFDRWVRNPARIVPRMEMPSVSQGIRGVLDGSVDSQLAAVWAALDTPGFTPPSPAALRIVRRSGLPETREHAAVLTEIIEVDEKPIIKPLVIGLPNRHNVLVDLGSNSFSAWWIGDTARQRTRGKSWYWEAGVPQLMAPAPRDPGSDFKLLSGGQAHAPGPADQYLTELDAIEHIQGGIELRHRLHFDAPQKTILQLSQRFQAAPARPAAQRSGFTRSVHLRNIPATSQIELLALGGDISLDASARAASVAGRHCQLQVTLRSPASARLEKTPRGAVLTLPGGANMDAACELEYQADVVPDPFLPLPRLDRSLTLQSIDVVPGFEAVRLPVTDEVMPTGLAWRPDGTLIVSSLEGRVWLGRDNDADGMPDALTPFSDDLAAPYGVAAAGQAIDVINKFGLLRLTDSDQDGHAERMNLLASGWGHTRDYHDWAVGLPRDEAGNYFVSLPCQQDERSEAGAHLRGSVVRLAPCQPTADDPRRYRVEPLAAGLRFPQGIALSGENELFVTDNQGNYTPFNELNHIVQGARYGFINRLESKRGLNPPFRPAAVEIPHPWTRSVNGICFLTAPEGTESTSAARLFGPLAGQLIGCEYDTRRLVRISLERVQGVFQGAVYAMSREPAEGEETFEGPLVCQVAPNGDVYVGNIRDSGWGAGANTGSLVRLRWKGDLPPGIGEIRAAERGFTIEFTAPVDADAASRADHYSLSSYRRIPTPSYGSPDQDRREEKIVAVHLAPDRHSASLQLDGLREGFVYEFHLRNLAAGAEFFPSEAYYTLRNLRN